MCLQFYEYFMKCKSLETLSLSKNVIPSTFKEFRINISLTANQSMIK